MSTPKILVISGQDDFLIRVCGKLSSRLCDELKRYSFRAVICPNLSDYFYTEHWVSLDNRSIGQLIWSFFAANRVPVVFHTYLDDAEVHCKWLSQYFRLNPTQSHLATSFDFKVVSSQRFFRRRLEILRRVEDGIGRPLSIVLGSTIAASDAIRFAQRSFPNRIHLLGTTPFDSAMRGHRLRVSPSGKLERGRDGERRRSAALVRENIQAIEDALLWDVEPNCCEVV